LGAAVAATAAVTFGSAGIASACGEPIGSQCNYIDNATGYTIYYENNGSTPIYNGTVANYTTLYGESQVLVFAMNANANTAFTSWAVTYVNSTKGEWNGYRGYSSGSADGVAGSFGNTESVQYATLTLGGSISSFTNTPNLENLIQEDFAVLPTNVRPSVKNVVVGFARQIPKFNVGRVQVGGALLANAYFDGYHGSATGLPGLFAYVASELDVKAPTAGVRQAVRTSRPSRAAVAPAATLPVAGAAMIALSATTPRAAAASSAPSVAKGAAPVRRGKGAAAPARINN